MLGAEPAMPDRGQVDVGEPGELAVEQDGRGHLDVAEQGLQARRPLQGLDDELHGQRGLARPRCPAEQRHQPRPDLDAGQLARSDRIERRRGAAQDVIPPAVEQVGGGLESGLAHEAPPSRCRSAWASPQSICRRVSPGVSPESRAASVSRACARAANPWASVELAQFGRDPECGDGPPIHVELAVAEEPAGEGGQLRLAADVGPPLDDVPLDRPDRFEPVGGGGRAGRGRVRDLERLGAFGHADDRFGLQVGEFVEREPPLVEPGLRMPGVRGPEEPRLAVDGRVDGDAGPLGMGQCEPLRRVVEARRGLGAPGRGRQPDVHPLPAAEEDEQVVVVEFAVAVEDGPAKPPGVAQGGFQVAGPVHVEPEHRGPHRGRYSPSRSAPAPGAPGTRSDR